ncbi:VUT family protein [Photobacterium leiognathi]|uniref:VUT family protein n=1 Tax=Photobacterium leiognathi TaxID=553611 RepID=UPI0027392219|nr:VUT family protein [Photobacterium leiognathi]
MQRKMKVVEVEMNYIKYANEDSSLTLIDTCENIIKKDLISLFYDKDQAEIYSNCHYKNVLMNKNVNWFVFISLLYLASLLLAIPMSPYSVSILGTIQPAGILIFPLSFVFLDVINSTVSYRHAKLLTFYGAVICVFASILIKLTFSVFSITDEYQLVFEKLSYLYIINAICILTADQLNNFIFSKFNTLFINKLWLKCVVSTVFGQAAYTVIWITLFFGHKMDVDLIERVIDNYGFKVFYAICLIPFTYFLVFIYRKSINK